MAKKMTGSSVGIVVTPRAIVAVQASAHENEIEVKVRGAVETPPETLSGQEVLDPLRLGHALRNLWRRIGLGEHAASVAVLAPSYGLRALRMPQAPERERNALVRGELEQAQVIPRRGGRSTSFGLPPGNQAFRKPMSTPITSTRPSSTVCIGHSMGPG